MYAIKVEVEGRGGGGADDADSDDERYAEAFAPPAGDLACVTFSAGNPRVEHVAGIVHLYRQIEAAHAGGGGGGGGGYGSCSTSGAGGGSNGGEGGSGGGGSGGGGSGGGGSGGGGSGGGGSGGSRSYLQAAGGAAAQADQQQQQQQQQQREEHDSGRSTTLCCLAIPADMPVAGFCSFVGAYMRHVKRMRVLRREGAGQSVCMVLLTFDQQEQADGFLHDFNGQPFSSLEPEILCRLVYVRSVECVGGGGGGGDGEEELADGGGGGGGGGGGAATLRCWSPGARRGSSVCNHQFHGECLKAWGDTSCPVCRYCTFGGGASGATTRCATCGTGANLWICLICGHVGCGRYRSGHASEHWKASSHCYALELETQRVWDYAGDGYVHRLIQSKTDGKLVEVPSPAPTCGHQPRRRASGACGSAGAGGGGGGGGGGAGGAGYGAAPAGGSGGGCEVCEHDADLKDALAASKLDAIAFEYNHLLTSQLDSQRQYFEGLLERQRAELEARAAAAAAAAERAAGEGAAAAGGLREAERRRAALERKLAESQAAAAKLSEEREFLRSLNETLLANQKAYAEKLKAVEAAAAEKDAAVKDLQEQVRDLMVYIEAGRHVQSGGGGEELAEATLLPLPQQQGKGKRRPGRK
ncbi:hypothetical protein Rsub_10711 [Raphidocelis subcapitata]|uniref:BRCA1-associated protein n=1 Tax=Raphidocelis subcapitata TaxID=307507 RepID=A0A2V0PEC4_9CHLO|nr:hypothetical protein Rsub_10711 [Raphidocelis subcapitata]|eukprot:GBF98211.1 hypothetical protein Rsub_10711 [Raphidocelis subcapitata]